MAQPLHATANLAFKQKYHKYLRNSVLWAIFIHINLFVFSPEFTFKPYKLREEKFEVVDVPDNIEIPPPPKEIAPPQVPVEAAADDADTEEEIAPTTFDSFEDNPHKPANIEPNTIVYTGTHDNDTCVGWFNGLQQHEKDFVFHVLGMAPTDDIAGLMIETAMHSRADLAIAPLQDFLGLDGSARLNTPGISDGNWRWRFEWDMLPEQLPQRIRSMIESSGRLYAR